MIKNQAEAANLEKFRNTSTGQFGRRPFADPGITLSPAAAYESRSSSLRKAAENLDREYRDAGRARNEACARIAAHELQATGMNPGRVLIEGDERYWYAAEAYSADGTPLHENQRTQVEKALREAGVRYDVRYRTEGVDLAGLSAEDHEDEDEDEDDSPAGYVGRLIEDMDSAFEAAGLDEEDPQTNARDLLTSFRHWADANGVDLEQALSGSYRVYLDESSAARAA